MNGFREMLHAGPRLGLCVMYPAPGIIERIGPDWDWLWIDGQHGELGYEDILAAVRAGECAHRPAIVRVPGHDAGQIGKALDCAAGGVMVPMVDTVEQATAIVRAAKFPPLGERSYGGRRPIDLWGRGYANPGHPEPLLVCQIETPEGLRNADAIAAVGGVDVLFFGPDDMALRAGMAMDVPRPEGTFEDAFHTVAQAALRHGKIAGGVFRAPAALQAAVDQGYRLIVSAGDVMFLSEASRAASDALHAIVRQPKS